MPTNTTIKATTGTNHPEDPFNKAGVWSLEDEEAVFAEKTGIHYIIADREHCFDVSGLIRAIGVAGIS